MFIVKNKDGHHIKITDIENGIVSSNDYLCISCEEKVVYVKQSERAISHFRHYNDSCIEKNNYSKNDIENEYNNDMSFFHKNWQFIFPNKYLEYLIKENNKLHRADIFINSKTDNIQIYDNNNELIFDEKNIKNLVIEIQNSRINNTVLQEREDFYRKKDKNRELLWIFNLKKECKLEKIIIFKNIFYRIKLTSFRHDFINLLKNKSNKSNIILDNNNEDLYIIRNTPNLDNDYLEVSKIKRNKFLEQISKYIECENITWNYNIDKTKLVLNDYDNSFENTNNKIINENIDKMKYLFYVLEKIPFLKYCDDIEINYIFSMFYYFSNTNYEIMNKFHKILKLYGKTSNTIMHFGKYKDEYLYNLPYDYLKWLNKQPQKYCSCKNNKICNDCNLREKLEEIIWYKFDYQKELYDCFYDIESFIHETKLDKNNEQIYEDWLYNQIDKNYSLIINYISEYIIFNYENVLLNIPNENKISKINNIEYIEYYEQKVYLKNILKKLKSDSKINCYYCAEYTYPKNLGYNHYNICNDCYIKIIPMTLDELKKIQKKNKIVVNFFQDIKKLDNIQEVDDIKKLDNVPEPVDGEACRCIHCDYYVWENNEGEYRDNGVIYNKNNILLHKRCKNSWLSNESSKNIKDKLKKMNTKEKDKWFNKE